MSESQSQKTKQSLNDSTQDQATPKYISRREAIKLLAVSTGALTMVAMTFPNNVTLPPKWMDPTVVTASPTPHAIASWVDGDETKTGGGDDTNPTQISADITEQAQTEAAYTPTEGPSPTDTLTPTETITPTDTPTTTSTRTPPPYHTKKPSPTYQGPKPCATDPASGKCP
jgi:hypothetical protein